MADTPIQPQENQQVSQGAQTDGPNGSVENRSFNPGEARGGPQAEANRQLADTYRRTLTDPWQASIDPFLSLQFDMNRWFDDFWRQATGLAGFPTLRTGRPFAAQQGASFGLPAADIKEADNAYLFTVELPGLKRDDVEVSLRQESIVISGHKQEELDDNTSTYRVSERRFGRFERTFPIPRDVNRDAIEASFRDGVLKLTLPKATEAQPQAAKIEIKS